MINLPEYREDIDKQEKGTPIYLSDYVFFVRRWGTPEAMKEQKQLSDKLFGPLHKFCAWDDLILVAHWLAEFGVVNWELKDENGKEIKFTKHNARALFLDESYFKSLNEKLFSAANAYENYLYDKAEDQKETIKKP